MTNQNTFRFFSPEDRVQNLIDRGLEIEDRRFASESIAWMGDQRLKHYWSYFMDYSIPGTHPRFKPGHNFDEIINLYYMDRELRFLLTRPLEVFEINLRNAIVKVLNESGFSYKWYDHGFLNSRDNLASKIQSKVLENRSAYSFISTYESRFYPEVEGMDYRSQQEYLTNNVRYPIQLVVETISVSYLSKIYSGLSKDLRDAIAEERFEGWDEFALNKAAARISVLRNAVSHHARVWNKELPHGSRMPYFMWTDLAPVGSREALRNYEAKSTFDMLTIFLDLMPKLEGSYAWNQEAHAFVDLLTPAQLEAMGFPRKWRMVSYWQPLNFDGAS